jgi:hypothetical protein
MEKAALQSTYLEIYLLLRNVWFSSSAFPLFTATVRELNNL